MTINPLVNFKLERVFEIYSFSLLMLLNKSFSFNSLKFVLRKYFFKCSLGAFVSKLLNLKKIKSSNSNKKKNNHNKSTIDFESIRKFEINSHSFYYFLMY